LPVRLFSLISWTSCFLGGRGFQVLFALPVLVQVLITPVPAWPRPPPLADALATPFSWNGFPAPPSILTNFFSPARSGIYFSPRCDGQCGVINPPPPPFPSIPDVLPFRRGTSVPPSLAAPLRGANRQFAAALRAPFRRMDCPLPAFSSFSRVF